MARTIRWSKIAIGATLAVAVVVGVSIVALLPDEKPRTGIAGRTLGPYESPLAGGENVSLEAATAEFGVPIYRPDMPLASDGAIRDVWIRGGDSPQIYMRYKSGIVLTIQPASRMPSTKEWADELVGDGIDGAIEDVAGIEAFVVRQHLPSLGSVRFFLEDSLVVVVGDGDFSTDELRDLALSTIQRADEIEAE